MKLKLFFKQNPQHFIWSIPVNDVSFQAMGMLCVECHFENVHNDIKYRLFMVLDDVLLDWMMEINEILIDSFWTVIVFVFFQYLHYTKWGRNNSVVNNIELSEWNNKNNNKCMMWCDIFSEFMYLDILEWESTV